jgi:hypothetical protein
MRPCGSYRYSILMLRHDMSKMIWSRMDVPVRSSLLAATWYRKWSLRAGVKPHVRDAMIKNAVEFEQMAVQVQLLLMRFDSRMALDSLERPSRLWKGQTGVDLAILGGCRNFIEVCCAEALDSRWSGDLNPYRQPLGLYGTVVACVSTGGLLAPSMVAFREPPFAEALRGPTQRRKRPKGMEQRFSISGSGSSSVSSSSNDQLFVRLRKLQDKDVGQNAHLLSKLEILKSAKKVTGMAATDLMSSSRLDFGFPFWERYGLFFAAPVTIFVLDAAFQIIQNLLFMFVLFSDRHEAGFSNPEKVLMTFMFSSTITEFVQALVESPTVYLKSMWNWVRMGSCIFFWMGVNQVLMQSNRRLYPELRVPQFILEVFDERALQHYVHVSLSFLADNIPGLESIISANFTTSTVPLPSTPAPAAPTPASASSWSWPLEFNATAFVGDLLPDPANVTTALFLNETGTAPAVMVHPGRMWDEGEGMFYSASLFCMWFRVLHLLSVHQDLGPLVISVKRIAGDIVSFAGIWGVLLLAFACAMQGTGLKGGQNHKCQTQSAGAEVDGVALLEGDMECWSSWWLWRTYYQSFGEPFFEYLSTDSSNILTIVLWPTMNLMLVNLLIALMNDTYVAVKDQSRLEWMIEMFQIAKEYRTPSRLNVLMLLNDVIRFVARYSEVKARMRQLQEKPTPGIFGYYVDLRFQFRKFQCNDLPQLEEAEMLRDLLARIQQVTMLEGVQAMRQNGAAGAGGPAVLSFPPTPESFTKGAATAESTSTPPLGSLLNRGDTKSAHQSEESIGRGVKRALLRQSSKRFIEKSDQHFKSLLERGWFAVLHPITFARVVVSAITHLPARLVPTLCEKLHPMNLEELHDLHVRLYRKMRRKRQKLERQRKLNDEAMRRTSAFLVLARNDFLRSSGTHFALDLDESQMYRLARASKAAKARMQAQMEAQQRKEMIDMQMVEGSHQGSSTRNSFWGSVEGGGAMSMSLEQASRSSSRDGVEALSFNASFNSFSASFSKRRASGSREGSFRMGSRQGSRRSLLSQDAGADIDAAPRSSAESGPAPPCSSVPRARNAGLVTRSPDP